MHQVGNSTSFRTVRAVAIQVAVVVALWATALRATAATEFSSRVWQADNGLPHSIVQAILQTRDGYLWVGTREGLARFNGLKFTPVEFTGENIPPSINALGESRDGSLWIGTQNAGLFRLHEGRLTHFRKEGNLAGIIITGIQEDRQGLLWISSSDGMYTLKDGKIERHDDLGNKIWSLAFDNQDGLWLATDYGLKHYQNGKVKVYTTADGLGAHPIRSVSCTQAGDVLIGTTSGLSRMTNGVITNRPLGAVVSGMVRTAFEDTSGNVWVGTYSGLNRLVGNELLRERGSLGSTYMVRAIVGDREGNVWVGSEEGLARFSPKPFAMYSKQEGLTDDRTLSVCGSQDGSIWIGTWGGGVNRLKDGKLTAYTKAKGLASDLVYSVFAGRDESVWVGFDYLDGLNRLKDDRITHYGRNQGLVDFAVSVIQDDQQGNLWVGTRRGLFRLNGERFLRYDVRNGLADAKINALCETGDGGMWIGTEHGLSRWSGGEFHDVTGNGKPIKDTVLCLYSDGDGLWIGTEGRGLKFLKDGTLSSFTTKEGLVNDIIYAILEDDHGNLWISSSKGIFKTSKTQLADVRAGKATSVIPVVYGRTEGIPSFNQPFQISQPAGWKGQDGRLWFRSLQGVLVTDPNQISRNELSPLVVIEDVIADGKRIPASRETSPTGETVPTPYASDATLRIPPGHGELEIRFAALSFCAPENNRAKYRLEGLDSDWVEAGAKRSAHYSNLATRKYRFRVIACNNDGVWNETGAAVAVILLPHFWQTWWFDAALVGAGILLLTVVYRVRVVQLRQIERLRLRIAADLHDEVGSSVGTISLLSRLMQKQAVREDEVRDLATIHRISTDVADSIKDIVWFINPENDAMDDLLMRMKDIASARLGAIDWRFVDPPQPSKRSLSHDFRQSVFLMFKETLTNITKHAHATVVEISISEIAGEWRLSIRDNGVGFDPDAVSRGNGLKNLRRRAEQLQGALKITSQPGTGGGTIVSFTTRQF
ncbi:MAG: hypothetical protein EXS24_00255 [Pedosphaera sp.]|nr:hypothetical protein [Pedosphaera sp.]